MMNIKNIQKTFPGNHFFGEYNYFIGQTNVLYACLFFLGGISADKTMLPIKINAIK